MNPKRSLRGITALLCAMFLCTGIPVHAEEEQVKISDKEYAVTLKDAVNVFIGNEKPVSGEIGSKVFLTYTVEQVTKNTVTQYSYIFPSFEQNEPMSRSYDKRSKYSIREIFRVLADEENYPIMFHCNAGADRTGTVAFLINGVLGVPYEDLTRDFELTSERYRSLIVDGAFAEGGVMQDNVDNYIAWEKMYQTMMRDYGTEDGTLACAIENYLVTVCKVREKEIEIIKSIMLE